MTKARDDVGEIPFADTQSTATLFGSWKSYLSGNPYLFAAEIVLDPSGTSSASVTVNVDEDGDSTADWSFTFAAPSGSGTVVNSIMIHVPIGGQLKFDNDSDPDGGNEIRDEGLWTT